VTTRILVVAAAVALLAGCGGSAHRQATTPPPTTHVQTTAKPKPQPKPKHPHFAIGKMTKLVVTVLDGDQRVRVRGARVSLWGKTARTNRHGVTTIKAPRGRHVVSVSARGYGHTHIPVDFSQNRWHTIDVYRPELQWPLYGATAGRTQAPAQIRLRPPFRLIWSRGLGGLIEFPAVVDDGVAYIGNARSTVHALSMRDGKFAWIHRTPGWPRMASSPAIDGNEIVYHTMGGWVYVLDRSDGHLKWSWDAGSAIESSPIIVNGVDYFGDAGGEMYALDLRTHRLKWRRYLGAKITSSAAISEGRLFVGDYAGHLWALSPATGATRWMRTVNGKIYGTPAVAHGRVFIPSSTGNSLTAFTTRGHYLWRDTAGYYVYSSPAVADGVVCWGSYTGWFYGSSAATGRILWRIPTGGPISGAAVIVDGVAYVGSFSHRIIGVNLHTGRRLVTFPHGQYVPVSGNGQRLLFNGFSRLYAVEPRHSKRRQLAR
jgi:outer membrane protein assembly factor BamB